MKPLKDEVLNLVPEIAKLVGTRMRRSKERYDDYVEVPGNGFVLRVRWQIERDSGLLVTLHKELKEDHIVPRELSIGWFVKFSGGPDEEDRALSSTGFSDEVTLVKKYVLDYLLGRKKDFDAVAEFADRVTEEESHYSQWGKANKWIRPEWPPSN